MGNETAEKVPAQPVDETRATLALIQKSIADGTQSLDAQAAALTARMTAIETAQRERNIPGHGSVPGLEDPKLRAKFSVLRSLLLINEHVPTEKWKDYRFPDGSNGGFEAECFIAADKTRNDIQTKTQVFQQDGLGGYLVPPEISTEMVGLLYAQTILAKLGARTFTASSTPLLLPKFLSGVTTEWHAPNVAPSKSTATFGQMEFTPKRVATHVKVAKQLIRWSNPAVEGILRANMLAQMALTVDIAGLEGTGELGQPTGLYTILSNQANTPQKVAHAGAAGGRLTYDMVTELIGKVEDANALTGSLGFATRPDVKRQLKKQTAEMYSAQAAGLGMPIFAPIVSDAALAEATGYPWSSTTQIAGTRVKGGSGATLGTAYFGNWSDLYLPTFMGLEFAASDVTGDSSGSAMLQRELWIVAFHEMDVGVARNASFAYSDELTRV